MAIIVGSVAVEIVPSARGFREKLAAALKDLPAAKVNVEARVDDKAAKAELDVLARDRKVNVKADTDKNSFTTAGKSISGLSGGIGLLASAGLALGPALLPVAAGLTVAFAGLAAPIALAAAGVGSFALFAVPAVTAVTKASAAMAKAQLAVNNALTPAARSTALARQAQLMKSLSPATVAAAKSLDTFKATFKGFQTALAPQIFGVFNAGLGAATALLPSLAQIARAVAPALTGLANTLASVFNSGGFKQFVTAIAHQVGPAVTVLGRIVGNLAVGFGQLILGVGAFGSSILPVVDRMAKAFAHLSDEGSNGGLVSFLSYARQNLPLVGRFLGDLVKAVGGLLVAFAPYGLVILKVLDAVLKGIISIVKNHPAIAGLAVVFGAVSLALIPLAPVIGGIATAIGAIGGVGVLAGVALAGLAAILVTAYHRSAPFRRVIGEIVTVLRDLALKALPVVQTIFRRAMDGIRAGIDTVSAAIARNRPQIDELIRGFKTVATFIIQHVLPILGPILRGVFTTLGRTIANVIGFVGRIVDAFNRIRESVQATPAAFHAVVGAISGFFARIGRDVSTFGHAIPAVFKRAVDAIKGFFARIGGDVGGAARAVGGAFAGIGKAVGGALSDALKTVKGWGRTLGRFLVDAVTTAAAPFRGAFKFVYTVVSDFIGLALFVIRKDLGVMGHEFQIAGTAVRKVWDAAWKAIRDVAAGALAYVRGLVTVGLAALGSLFTAARVRLTAIWNVLFAAVKAVLTAAWTAVRTNTSIAFGAVAGLFNAVKAKVLAVWNALFGAVKSVLTTAWAFVRGTTSTATGAVVGLFNSAKVKILAVWNPLWGGVKKIAADAISVVKSGIGIALGAIQGAFRTAVSAISSVWGGLKAAARAPVAFIVNTVYTGGIKRVFDAVSDAVGYGKHLPAEHFAAGGIIPGPVSPVDNRLIWARSGEGVIVPEAVRALGGEGAINALNRAFGGAGPSVKGGRQAFAGGGVLGSQGAPGSPKANSGGLGGALSGIASNILGAFTDPAGTFKKLLGGVISKIGSSPLAQLGGAAMNKLVDALGGVLKKAASTILQSFGGGGSPIGGAVGGGAARWLPTVLQVLHMLGQSPANAPAVLRRINFESGGNPNAINLTDCVTLDTMILTRRGWLKHDEVQVGDETIGFNPVTNGSEWTPITGVVHYNQAPLVRLGNARWHAIVTPNHRWVSQPRATVPATDLGMTCDRCNWPEGVRRRGATTEGGLRIHLAKAHGLAGSRPVDTYGPSRMVETRDIGSRDRLVLAAVADTGEGLSITDTEAAILGWLAGDGHIEEGRRGKSMSIAQSKPPMVKKLRTLLADSSVAVYVDERLTRTGKIACGPRHQFRFKPAYRRDLLERVGHPKSDAESIVLRMSATQRRLWLDAFIDAEGHRDGQYVSISQTYGPILQAAHLAIYLCGYRPRLVDNNVTEPSWSPSAHISLGRPVVAGGFLKQTDAGVGDVWCPTTELGTWTAEQDGQFFLTGNSNARAGYPSQGLMQTIPATFRSNAGPFVGLGITNPLANIYAGLHYAIARYGSIAAIDPLVRHQGYANGGVIPEPVFGVGKSGRTYTFAEKGPELVIPHGGTTTKGTEQHFYFRDTTLDRGQLINVQRQVDLAERIGRPR